MMSNTPPTDPPVDEPGRTLDQPHKKLDLVQAYKLRVVHRLSFSAIAKALDVPKSTVHAALSRLVALVPDPEVVKAYEEVEATILTSAKERLLASCLDEDTIKKASLNNRAYAFTQIADQERLVKNLSTGNIGVMARLIVEADQDLFKKQSAPIPPKEQPPQGASVRNE